MPETSQALTVAERWVKKKILSQLDMEDGPHSTGLLGGPTGLQNRSAELPARD